MFENLEIRTQNLIMLIFLFLYSLIVMIVIPIKGLVFWINYAFTILAFILVIILNNKLFNSKIKQSFNGLPLSIISYVYLLIQTVFSFVLMLLTIITTFQIPTFEISLIIGVIILAIFIIMAILLLKSANYIENIEKTTKEEVNFAKRLQKEVEIIYNKNNNGNYKNQLFELYEIVRYCNPISTSQIKILEEEITKNLENLKLELKNKNENQILNLIKTLKNNLNEREIKLK